MKERRVASRRVAIVPRDVGVRGRRGKKVDARLDAAGLLTKVLLLELAGQVALDERGLACAFEAGGGWSANRSRVRGRRRARQILKKVGGRRKNLAPAAVRRARRVDGTSARRTGTTVTDEDELESRGLSGHLC